MVCREEVARHQPRWRGEGSAECLRAGASLSPATAPAEILGPLQGVWGQTAFPGGRACLFLAGSGKDVWGRAPALGKELGLVGVWAPSTPLVWGQGCSPFPAWVGPRGLKDAQAAMPSLVLCNWTGGRLRLYLAGECPFLIMPTPG